MRPPFTAEDIAQAQWFIQSPGQFGDPLEALARRFQLTRDEVKTLWDHLSAERRRARATS